VRGGHWGKAEQKFWCGFFGKKKSELVIVLKERSKLFLFYFHIFWEQFFGFNLSS
jgi:hypothetical protein